MTLTFDPNTDAVFFSIESRVGGAPKTEDFELGIDGVHVTLFYAIDGRVVGIEVVGASRFLAPDVLESAMPE